MSWSECRKKLKQKVFGLVGGEDHGLRYSYISHREIPFSIVNESSWLRQERRERVKVAEIWKWKWKWKIKCKMRLLEYNNQALGEKYKLFTHDKSWTPANWHYGEEWVFPSNCFFFFKSKMPIFDQNKP